MPQALCRDCCRLWRAPPNAPTVTCPLCGSRRVLAHPELHALTIAHVDCDAFYAAIEKRDRPELRTRPLIVGHAGGRGVVTTACYIARRYGVRSAMPMFKARELCPQAVILPPSMARYKEVSGEIRAIFAAATPIIEPVSLDEAYLDLAGEHRLDARSAAECLATIARRVEREVRITVSIGLAPNKLLAKLASDLDKPRGFSVIGAAEASAFLAPLPVSRIHGVGFVTAQRLERQGIATIADLQALSETQLVLQYGRFGRRLAQFSHGRDDRRVSPARGSKSVSAETTFSRDLASADQLVAIAGPLCERVSAQLVRKHLAGGTAVLKLKTSDFQIITRNRRLANPTQRAETLLDAVRPLIEREADGRRFRLIGVGVDQLTTAEAADPPDLFGQR
jgi:DNA polymerase-4